MTTTQTANALIKFLVTSTLASAADAGYLPVGVFIEESIYPECVDFGAEILLIGSDDFLRVMITVAEIAPGVWFVTLFAEGANDDGVITFSACVGSCLVLV